MRSGGLLVCVALFPSVPERGGPGPACLVLCLGLLVALAPVLSLCGMEAVPVLGLPLIVSTTEQLGSWLLCVSM